MADGNITVEVRTQAAQAELDRLRADNAALRRERPRLSGTKAGCRK